MPKAKKKTRLSLREVFLKEGPEMSRLQGTHKSTPRNVYVPDTTQNIDVTTPARTKLKGESSCDEGACCDECGDGGVEEPIMMAPDVVVVKLGHHAGDGYEGDSGTVDSINIGRVGAPGGPDLSNSSPRDIPQHDDDMPVLHDDEYQQDEGSVFGTGGLSKEDASLPGHQSIDTVRWELENQPEEADPGRPSHEMHESGPEDNDDDDGDPDDKYEDEAEGRYEKWGNDWKPRIAEVLGSFVGEDDLGF